MVPRLKMTTLCGMSSVLVKVISTRWPARAVIVVWSNFIWPVITPSVTAARRRCRGAPAADGAAAARPDAGGRADAAGAVNMSATGLFASRNCCAIGTVVQDLAPAGALPGLLDLRAPVAGERRR